MSSVFYLVCRLGTNSSLGALRITSLAGRGLLQIWGLFSHPASVGLCTENILFSLLRTIDPDDCLGQLDP